MIALRHRLLILSGCVALASALAPAAALAHAGGSRHGRGAHTRVLPHGSAHRDGFQLALVQRVCAQAGAPLGGTPHWQGHVLTGLTETQVNELKAACEKLTPAYTAERKADEAAWKVLWEALAADRKKLDEACPALTEPHEPGRWTEPSAACKEAFATYATASKEAEKANRTADEEAGKTFEKPLGEFEASTRSIFEALAKAAESEHPSGHGGWGSGGAPGLGGGRAGGRRGF